MDGNLEFRHKFEVLESESIYEEFKIEWLCVWICFFVSIDRNI